MLALILNFVAVYFSLKLLGKDQKQGASEKDKTSAELGEREEGESTSDLRQDDKESDESQYFCLKAAICAVWIPSVVGNKDKMYLMSAVVSLISKVALLCLAVGIAFSGSSKLDFSLFLPLIYIFKYFQGCREWFMKNPFFSGANRQTGLPRFPSTMRIFTSAVSSTTHALNLAQDTGRKHRILRKIVQQK